MSKTSLTHERRAQQNFLQLRLDSPSCTEQCVTPPASAFLFCLRHRWLVKLRFWRACLWVGIVRVWEEDRVQHGRSLRRGRLRQRMSTQRGKTTRRRGMPKGARLYLHKESENEPEQVNISRICVNCLKYVPYFIRTFTPTINPPAQRVFHTILAGLSPVLRPTQSAGREILRQQNRAEGQVIKLGGSYTLQSMLTYLF